MVLNLKLFKFIFRHKWDSPNNRWNPMFKTYSLGLWIKPYKAMASSTNYKRDGKITHVKGYMIGIDLIIAKTWIDITFGKPLTIKI
ncbi:MAG TPA: hypothetical protein PLG47_06250 [Candidatus Dojkabacteria bacterium]|nr:hypothetical protein [Candidatus Dojkabacteria bacterium]